MNYFLRFLLRPFQSSTTYKNLKRTGEGVLHITDDVSIFANAVIRDRSKIPNTEAASQVQGFVLADCCRYFEFKVTFLDDKNERTEIQCQTVLSKERRAFWGFNRAKHAVIEAAILASRVGLIEADDITQQIKLLKTIVEKTAGEVEHTSFERIEEFLTEQLRIKR